MHEYKEVCVAHTYEEPCLAHGMNVTIVGALVVVAVESEAV